jgi:hypothetical protein
MSFRIKANIGGQEYTSDWSPGICEACLKFASLMEPETQLLTAFTLGTMVASGTYTDELDEITITIEKQLAS